MLASPLTRLALAPVLIAQGLRVRQIALVMPEPEGPREGVHGVGAPLRLLICGDSSAAGVGAPHQDQALSGHLVRDLARDHALTWQVQATSGWTTAQALAHLRALPALGMDAAVVALGVNDVTRQVPLRRWRAQVRDVVEVLRARHGVSRVYWSGFPPIDQFPLLPQPLRAVIGAVARRHDDALAEMAGGVPGLVPGLARVAMDLDPAKSQMAEDGFHPGPSIYAQWAGCLAARIRADGPPDLGA